MEQKRFLTLKSYSGNEKIGAAASSPPQDELSESEQALLAQTRIIENPNSHEESSRNPDLGTGSSRNRFKQFKNPFHNFSSANTGPFARAKGGRPLTCQLIPCSSHLMGLSLRPRASQGPMVKPLRPQPSPSLHQPLPPWRQHQHFPLILNTRVLLPHRKRTRPLSGRLLLMLFSYLPINWSLKR